MKKLTRRAMAGAAALALITTCVPVQARIWDKPALSASCAERGKYGDWRYYIYEDSDGEYISINEYTGNDEKAIIPNKINGIPVKAIDDKAFISKNIISVKIPDTVTSIGNGAFAYCKNLEEINLPSALERINVACFKGCTKLKEIDIPSGVTGIEDDTFCDCSSLKKISIPDTVIYIYGYAFSGCKALETITIPDSVEKMSVNALDDFYPKSIKLSDNLKEVPNIPNTITELTLPYYAESVNKISSYNLEKLTIGAKLKSLDNIPLNGANLKEINVNKDNPYFSSKNGILYDKEKTKLIAYPAAIKKEKYVAPETVTQICESSINNNYLKDVYLSENVSSIEPYAFTEAYYLDNIYIYNKDCEIYMAQDTFDYLGIIHGYKGSTAEEYAETYDRTFVEITEPFPTEDFLEYDLGDVNGDSLIDATDASDILSYYANVSTGGTGEFNEGQKEAGDLDKNGTVDATDASTVLAYYAYISTTSESRLSVEEFIAERNESQEQGNSDEKTEVYPIDFMGKTVNEMIAAYGEPNTIKRGFLGAGGYDTGYVYDDFAFAVVPASYTDYVYDDRNAAINYVIGIKGGAISEDISASMTYNELSEKYSLDDYIHLNDGYDEYLASCIFNYKDTKYRLTLISSDGNKDTPVSSLYVTTDHVE